MKIHQKEILPHPEFYLVKFTKDRTLPYLLFVHGGPGLNCGTLEYCLHSREILEQLAYKSEI